MAAKQLDLTGYRICSAAKSTLQHAAESYVTQTFVQANLGHAKRRDSDDGHEVLAADSGIHKGEMVHVSASSTRVKRSKK